MKRKKTLIQIWMGSVRGSTEAGAEAGNQNKNLEKTDWNGLYAIPVFESRKKKKRRWKDAVFNGQIDYFEMDKNIR